MGLTVIAALAFALLAPEPSGVVALECFWAAKLIAWWLVAGWLTAFLTHKS